MGCLFAIIIFVGCVKFVGFIPGIFCALILIALMRNMF